MKTEAKMRYTIEVSARELNVIRRSLEHYHEANPDKKGLEASQLATSITKQVQQAYKQITDHFTAMLSLAVSGKEEDDT